VFPGNGDENMGKHTEAQPKPQSGDGSNSCRQAEAAVSPRAADAEIGVGMLSPVSAAFRSPS
jgi:hypothetical protein